MSIYTFKSCNPIEDRDNIVELLYSLKDELYLPDQAVCQQVADLCFRHGGVIGGYDGDRLCAMMGYFWGDPQHEFANKEVAFMYVAGIRQSHRLSRVFHKGLVYSLQHFQKMGKKTIQLQAEAANPYTNKLYGRFAQPIAKSKSLRGKEVITYGGSINEALSYLQSASRPARSVRQAAHHQQAMA